MNGSRVKILQLVPEPLPSFRADVTAMFGKYLPREAPEDNFSYYGYSVAATIVQVLRQCGNDLSRENIMRQAASMKDYRIDTLLPGVTLTTSSSDYAPIEAVQLQRFNGKQWELFGEVMSGR